MKYKAEHFEVDKNDMVDIPDGYTVLGQEKLTFDNGKTWHYYVMALKPINKSKYQTVIREGT